MKVLEEYQGPRARCLLLSGSEAYRAGDFLETPLLKVLEGTITAYNSVYSRTIRRGEGRRGGRGEKDIWIAYQVEGGGRRRLWKC